MLGGEHAGRDEGGSLFTKNTNVLILRCLHKSSGHNKQTGTRSSASVCYVSECKGSLLSLQGFELDGAFSVCVTDGVNVWVGVCLGVAGPAWAHTVLLLTEQSGGLSRPVIRPSRGRVLLGLGGQGGGLSWMGVKGARRCTHGGRRCLGEGGVVTRRGSGLRQRLARSAAGGRGRLGQRGAAARRGSVRRLAPCRRRGQQQWIVGPRWDHGGQRDRYVQTSVTALWRLWHAIQLGCQETVLVLSTSDLRGAQHH